MDVDLLLDGARVVTPTATFERGWVAVTGERIAAVGPASETPPASAARRDLEGLVLLPGMIDPHTHPGNYGMFRDELGTETRSAARGGLTTILGIVKSTRLGGAYNPMVTAADVRSYLDVFDEGLETIHRDSNVDVALTFIIMNDQHAAEIPQYAARLGVTTFKFFPSAAAPTAWHAAIGTPSAGDDGTLYVGLRNVREIGGLASFHPENNQVTRVLEGEARASGLPDLEAWERRSPAFLEAYDIAKMAFFGARTGATIYPVHVNSREGLAAIARAKSDGVAMIAETCARYLVLAMPFEGDPALAKMSPPIRRAEDRAALWQALADGTLDTVGSDHSPMSASSKGLGGDFWAAKAGAGDVGSLLPVLLGEGVARGRLTLERLVEVSSSNPARAFGLYPRKGAIAVGSDADLVAVDLQRRRPIRGSDLQSIADWSPYEGLEVTGWPVFSVLRGRPLLDGDAVSGPRGSYLSRVSGAPLDG
jgi:dihydroorotase-like cyclic amidohydrolase